ncbi:hypothetical protein AB0N07_31050 [Streptomyces sp. NPDC051172]|uniref:hypothetical protein n=1 Tax=Streptomyces sp. NPDC051172 TaxID=3155796 RepID=UPI0034475B53
MTNSARRSGVSATVTGLTVLVFPLGVGSAGPAGGWLAHCYGARRVPVFGACLTAVRLLLLARLGDGWSPPDVAWQPSPVWA